ncbi:MAG: nucleoside triphosphate pyrophosphohydrolase family protein [Candidatus Paceibacterota bacterium]
MEFNEYQKMARTTAIYSGAGKNFIYPVLGLCGESGEVAEKIKKIIRDGGGIVSEEQKRELEKELGDVLWYVANLGVELGLDMDDIASKNIAKLKSRQERGVLHGSGDNR